MADATEAPTQDEKQEDQNAAPIEEDAKMQAHSVELPEASENATATSGGQLDILLDMDVPVTVVLGATQVPVRRLLQLGPGAVLTLEKTIEAPADLYLKESKFAEADIVVVDNRFAVRVRQIMRAGVAATSSEG